MIHKLLNLTRPLFVVDTETTGVDPRVDRIVELGFERWTAEGMNLEWRSLVNPGIPIPPEATKVHGITDADVADKPSFKSLAPSLLKGFAICDYAGKNVRFDLRIVAAEMQRAGTPWDYSLARIVDNDRLEQIAVPRDLGTMYAKYVKVPCTGCNGKGWIGVMNASLGTPLELERCAACNGAGSVPGPKHEGAHGALSDVRASRTVIERQLEAHAVLPRDLDQLHALQWPGWITAGGEFRIVDGVPRCQFGKHKGKPMELIDVGYWDWILRESFPADVKRIAMDAKLGKFPEAR